MPQTSYQKFPIDYEQFTIVTATETDVIVKDLQTCLVIHMIIKIHKIHQNASIYIQREI